MVLDALTKPVSSPWCSIFGSEKRIEAPESENIFKEKGGGNLGFAEFLEKNKKFAKPYGQSAKYIDLLNKNHILLRRGAF